MISIIITSFREPHTISKAIESFIRQDIRWKYELIVVCPDKETQDVVKRYSKKHKEVKLFKDPGKGKSLALNLVLQKIRGEIAILSDGDVYVSKNSVNEIMKAFEKKNTGCVSGRPVSLESRDSIYGYWSHALCHAAHKLREKRAKKGEFLECSGYLWAFRNKVIRKFPLNVAEDTIVPILFWLRGYKIAYTPKAEVYVRYPKNLKDFIKQKKRAAASHETISLYVNREKIPRMKGFMNEILESYHLLFHPINIEEFLWIMALFPLRLYIWINLLYNQIFRGRYYRDAWQRVESTK